MQTDLIHVNRLDALYLLPKSQARASASVQERLDKIARNLLVRRLENQFAALSDTGMYFIERLELDLSLDIDDGDEALAEAWARALLESVQKTISRNAEGLIVFPDRAVYVASLVEHLLRGSSGDYWYFKEFASLRSQTLGQAISMLLREDPDEGRDVMIELTRRGDLDLLLNTLTEAELADIVSECLLPASPTFAPRGSYQRWTKSLHTLLSNGPVGLTSVIPRDVARLYLSLLRVEPELGPDVNLARFIRDILELRQSILAVDDCPALLRVIESEEVALCLAELGGRAGGPVLASLIRESGGAEATALLRDLEVLNTPTGRIATDYGGIFLLAPAILELGVAPLLDRCAYPDPSLRSKTSLLIFLVGLQCLGPNAQAARQDRALATFAGLPDAPSQPLIREYCEKLTPGMHRRFAEMLRPIVRESQAHPRQKNPAESTSSPASWFTLCAGNNPLLADRQFDAALSDLSRAILQRFALTLGAFSDSGPQYLCRNFLASRAVVETSAESILVHFLTCPLQMVLRMAGFDQRRWQIPWADGRNLEFRFE